MRPITAAMVLALIAWASLSGACGGGGGDEPFAEEQQAYDQWLAIARRGVAEDPAARCVPSYWTNIANTHGGPDLAELIELAYADACIEAGHLSDAEFSIYYAGSSETP